MIESDARKAIIDAVVEVDQSWERLYAVYFGKELLAALNRAGWRLVRKAEGDL